MQYVTLISIVLLIFVGCAPDVELSGNNEVTPISHGVPTPTPVVITEPAVITVEEANVDECPLGGKSVLSNGVVVASACVLAIEVEVPVPTECSGPGKSDEDPGKSEEDHGKNNEPHGHNGK